MTYGCDQPFSFTWEPLTHVGFPAPVRSNEVLSPKHLYAQHAHVFLSAHAYQSNSRSTHS